MIVLKWMVFGLSFFCYFSGSLAATPLWSEKKLDKYIKRKLKRNPTVLRISEKPIGNQGAHFLAQSPRLKSIMNLVIYKSQIGDEGVRAIAASPHLENLQGLYERKNPLPSELGKQHIDDRCF